jgi:hypothetical protein
MIYHYSQNNPGGFFNERMPLHLFVEADDHHEANDRAVDYGVYFDGVQAEIDCDCCGDRWHRAYLPCDDEIAEIAKYARNPLLADGHWKNSYVFLPKEAGERRGSLRSLAEGASLLSASPTPPSRSRRKIIDIKEGEYV